MPLLLTPEHLFYHTAHPFKDIFTLKSKIDKYTTSVYFCQDFSGAQSLYLLKDTAFKRPLLLPFSKDLIDDQKTDYNAD